MLQYDADQERLVCLYSYTHPLEIWDIAPCPVNEGLFLTVWSKGGAGRSVRASGVATSVLRGYGGCLRTCQCVCVRVRFERCMASPPLSTATLPLASSVRLLTCG